MEDTIRFLKKQYEAEVLKYKKEAEEWQSKHEILEAALKDADFLWEKLAQAEGNETLLREKRVGCQWNTCKESAEYVLPRPFIFVCLAHKEEWTEKGKRRK